MEHAWTRARWLLRSIVLVVLAIGLCFFQTSTARADGSSTAADSPTVSAAETTAAASPTPTSPSDTSSSAQPSGQTGQPTQTTAVAPSSTTPGAAANGVIAPAGTGSSSGGTPSGTTSSTGVTIVTGGQPNIPSVSNQPLPSTSAIQDAIRSFLSSAIGVALPGAVQAVVGQSALYQVDSGTTAQDCRCTVALSISVGGSASAVAIAGSGPAAASGSAVQRDTSTNIGSDVPGAETSGSTGNAMSISISGHGPAIASATSGNSGVAGAGASALTGAVVHQHVTFKAGALSADALGLTLDLLVDSGPTAAQLNALPCGRLECGVANPPATADVATYVPGGTSCAPARSNAEWCTVAIAISLGGGQATASVAGPAGSVSTNCASGLVGRPTAIAIGVGGPAQAIAHMGAGGGSQCAGHTALGAPTASPVTAASGSTGNSLAIGIAQQGPAGANAASGNAGLVRAITDGTGNGAAASAATATTGATGDAVGISVGKLAANAIVRSGSSGRAAALCTHCSLAGGQTVADAVTGHTGGSYALAVAGEQSYANAASGDSGDAASWAVHGSGTVFTTGQATVSTPDNVVQTGDTGPVIVTGQSGDTGNVVVTATDLLTWVSVLTQSGNAGPVLSTARWNADGCTLNFATFTMTCTPPNPQQDPIGGSSAQMALDPVVSAPERGAVPHKHAVPLGLPPAFSPVTNAGSAGTTGHLGGVQPAGAANQAQATPASGSGSDGTGGARTRLVSSDVARPAVSESVFGPLSSWWAMLTICVVALFLVALIFVAWRYGRPNRMNSS